jgi:hypothetical protein
MPRILKNIRIDEVSAVTKGAGEGTRVVLMKRDDSADDDDVYSTDWYRQQAAIAERQNEEHLRREEIGKAARERFIANWNKSFAADALGDEATHEDEEVPADELAGSNDHPAHKAADLLVQSGSHNTREEALAYLLHNPRGAAMLRRLTKSDDQPTMTDYKTKLYDLAKRAGPIAIAKVIVDDDNAYGISEHDLTALVTECAKREHPQLTDAQAFVRMFTDQSEAGVTLRKAFNVVKAEASADSVTSFPFPKF